MKRKHYPSDISREQFEQIRPLLEGARKKTCPRRQDLYDIFCGILYLLKNAATWRALPGDFPSPSTVRYYFDQWSQVPEGATHSLLEQALKNQVAQERENNGRQRSASFCIVDAQSVKNTDTAQCKGYDAGCIGQSPLVSNVIRRILLVAFPLLYSLSVGFRERSTSALGRNAKLCITAKSRPSTGNGDRPLKERKSPFPLCA
jgi:transposase